MEIRQLVNLYIRLNVFYYIQRFNKARSVGYVSFLSPPTSQTVL